MLHNSLDVLLKYLKALELLIKKELPFLLYFQKESIIFSLYSSNWTEMDMKYENCILLIMKMNNAHPNKLKFSQLRVVNLQMFLGVRI